MIFPGVASDKLLGQLMGALTRMFVALALPRASVPAVILSIAVWVRPRFEEEFSSPRTMPVPSVSMVTVPAVVALTWESVSILTELPVSQI